MKNNIFLCVGKYSYVYFGFEGITGSQTKKNRLDQFAICNKYYFIALKSSRHRYVTVNRRSFPGWLCYLNSLQYRKWGLFKISQLIYGRHICCQVYSSSPLFMPILGYTFDFLGCCTDERRRDVPYIKT